jgi:hypothetical protein
MRGFGMFFGNAKRNDPIQLNDPRPLTACSVMTTLSHTTPPAVYAVVNDCATSKYW